MKLALAFALMTVSVPALAQTTVAADTPGKTATGINYVQPKDWALVTTGPKMVFTAPEGDLNIVVVEVGEASDARTAAAKAWTIYKPAADRTVRMVSPGRPGEGWDERVGIAYEISPNERAVVSASAQRKGKAWTVLIVDGSGATAGKRSAALSVVQGGLHPAGYTAETFAGKTAHRLTPERIAMMREFAAQSAKELGIPGIGLAFLDQGKVVWEGGVGVRELGKPEPVEANTKFMVASNTKGMATLLLSVLADEGKLRWDQKVVDLYPPFRLGDDATTQAVEVRHLVCACTGLPRQDYAFILADRGLPASDTFRGLAATQPTSKFGELFQYNNLMASAAGYLGGHLAYPGMELGAAFDKAMDTRIFGPLKMVDSTFDLKLGTSGNWAHPHSTDIDGKLVVISNAFNETVYPHRPAGGAFSTAADMAHYVQLELTKGIGPDGKRVVSEANLLERRKRGVQVTEDSWYGMGLFERMAWGVPVVTHGGTLMGYHSTWFALPDSGVGAVILTNADAGATLLAPFLRRLLEVMYDGEPQAAKDVATIAERLKRQGGTRRARLTIPGDPAIVAKLAGQYRSPGIGTISITDRDGGKWIKAGFIEGPLATRSNADGSVSIVSTGPGGIAVDAVVGEDQGVRTLTIRDAQTDYVYREVR